MTNPAEYPNLSLLEVKEREFNADCQRQPVELPYDDQGHILRGIHKGEHVDDITRRVIARHLAAGRFPVTTDEVTYPWWRWFRPTRTVTIRLPLFDQAFDDGGPA